MINGSGKKKSLETESKKLEEFETEKNVQTKVKHKLVLKDASDGGEPYSGRSNVILNKQAEEAKGNLADTLEEISEGNENNEEDNKEIFFEIVKMSHKEFEINEIKKFVMK